MFVSGPYVRRNSFSIGEVVNYTISQVMGLQKQLRLSESRIRQHDRSSVTYILCVNLYVFFFKTYTWYIKN